MKEKLKIVIISAYHLPDHAAQANRILSYAKGMCQLRHKVSVLQIVPHYSNSRSEQHQIVDGVPIHYLTCTNHHNVLIFKLLTYWSIFKSIGVLYHESRKEKINVFMLQSENLIDRIVYYFLKKFSGSILISDISEYPYFLFDNFKNPVKKLNAHLRFMLDLRIYDGIFFISTYIQQFFLRYNQRITSEIIPITVDTDRFREVADPGIKINGPYLAFCGSLYGDKDGIEILIDAFDQIHQRFKNYKLVLIGDNSDNKQLANVLARIDRYNLADSVIFTGLVHRDVVPGILSNATMFLLARPGNKQAEGGFPTKLGEYLAAGKAVVVTRVGDIPKYFTDGMNSFIAEPGDANSFALKSMEALADHDSLSKVGYEGLRLAEHHFHYMVIAKKMIDFMNSLLNLKR